MTEEELIKIEEEKKLKKIKIDNIIKESSKDFLNVVWPVIKDNLGGGEIVPVETVTDSDVADCLDMLAGIDLWKIDNKKLGMIGIANRIQWKDKAINPHTGLPWNSFTIRETTSKGYKYTEFQKRQYALQNLDKGILFPAITIQSYLDDKGGNLLSSCAVMTSDLFKCLEMGPDGKQINKEDGTVFIFQNWGTLRKRKFKLLSLVDNSDYITGQRLMFA